LHIHPKNIKDKQKLFMAKQVIPCRQLEKNSHMIEGFHYFLKNSTKKNGNVQKHKIMEKVKKFQT